MARLLEAVAVETAPELYDPARLLRLAREDSPLGTEGSQPYLKWQGVCRLHCLSCPECQSNGRFAFEDRITECAAFRCLWQLSTEGVRPFDMLSEARGVRQFPFQSIWTAYPAKSADDHKFATDQSAEYVESGVAAEVSTRERKRRQRAGLATSSAFIIKKWKQVLTEEALAATHAWAREDPVQVQQFFAQVQGAEEKLPAGTFSAKRRMVYHFKNLNFRSVKCPLVYSSLEDAVHSALQADWLAALDLKDGFTGIKVDPSQVDAFHVLVDGLPDMELRRLPFGYRLAPYFFCMVSGAITASIQAWLAQLGNQVRASVYVDDILLAMSGGAETLPEAEARMIVENAKHLVGVWGLKLNTAKLQGPAKAVTYLGVDIASHDRRVAVGIPPDKLFSIMALLDFLLVIPPGQHPVDNQGRALPLSDPGVCNSRTVVKGAYMSLVGKLQGVAFLTAMGEPRLGDLYAPYGVRSFRNARVCDDITIHRRQMEALSWFRSTLQGLVPTPLEDIPGLRRTLMRRASFAASAATDASGEGGLGGWFTIANAGENHMWYSEAWTTRLEGTSADDELVGMSTVLELAAIVLLVQRLGTALRLSTTQSTDGVCILDLMTDSQATVAIIKKMYSTRSENINKLCQVLAKLRERFGIWLTPRWVPREENVVADALSHPDVAPVRVLLPATVQSGPGEKKNLKVAVIRLPDSPLLRPSSMGLGQWRVPVRSLTAEPEGQEQAANTLATHPSRVMYRPMEGGSSPHRTIQSDGRSGATAQGPQRPAGKHQRNGVGTTEIDHKCNSQILLVGHEHILRSGGLVQPGGSQPDDRLLPKNGAEREVGITRRPTIPDQSPLRHEMDGPECAILQKSRGGNRPRQTSLAQNRNLTRPGEPPRSDMAAGAMRNQAPETGQNNVAHRQESSSGSASYGVSGNAAVRGDAQSAVATNIHRAPSRQHPAAAAASIQATICGQNTHRGVASNTRSADKAVGKSSALVETKQATLGSATSAWSKETSAVAGGMGCTQVRTGTHQYQAREHSPIRPHVLAGARTAPQGDPQAGRVDPQFAGAVKALHSGVGQHAVGDGPSHRTITRRSSRATGGTTLDRQVAPATAAVTLKQRHRGRGKGGNVTCESAKA